MGVHTCKVGRRVTRLYREHGRKHTLAPISPTQAQLTCRVRLVPAIVVIKVLLHGVHWAVVVQTTVGHFLMQHWERVERTCQSPSSAR